MKKNILKIIAVLVFATIFINNITFALADNQEWKVVKDDILIFDILELNDGETIESGTFNVSITNINSTGALFYDIDSDLTIDNKNYTANLTATNDVEIGEKLIVLSVIDLIFSLSQTDLMKENDDNDYLKLDQHYFDLYNGDSNVRYSLIKLTYGYELKLEDDNQGINLYIKMQRDHDGILTHYQIANLNVDGLETSIKITFNSFGGVEGSSIPGFNVELLLFLSVFTFIGIIYKRKR